MKYKLGEIATVTKLAGFEFTKYMKYIPNGEIIAIRALNLKNGTLVLEDVRRIARDVSESLERSQLYKNDIVLSYTGTVGECAQITENGKYHLAPNVCKITPKVEVVDPIFLFQYVRSSLFKQVMLNYCHGSTQPTIPMTTIRELPVEIEFDTVQQRKVADIISCIDDKIALNQQINKNLEEQIRSRLSQMLSNAKVAHAKLGEYLYIKGRIGWKGLKKSEYLDCSPYRIINGESLTKNGIDWNKAGYISKERYLESPEIMLQVGDILMSKDGTIGKIGYIDSLDAPTSVASGIFVIRNQQPEIISTVFIYFIFLSSWFNQFIVARTEGSVIPHLYQKDFMEFEFPMPSLTEMKRFDKIAIPMFDTIINNLSMNKKLAAIRDALLPRLMSGEIDVSGIEIK